MVLTIHALFPVAILPHEHLTRQYSIQMDSDKKQFVISPQTRQKVESAKLFIERRYAKLILQEKDKKENWDLLYKKMQSMNLSENEQERVKLNILHKEAEQLRLARRRMSIKDYELIKIVGRGAFGQVRLCRSKQSAQPVAIKKMKKSLMIHKNKVIQARQEKDILANSENSPWIVDLKCSFQDESNLYLVMEYLPGGDLMNLLMKKDIFTEEESRFYTAEILLALSSVHELNYIHRDLKPDNILIDANGHIKLSDFGLCKHTEVRPKKLNEAVAKKDDDLLKKKFEFHIGLKENYRRNRKLAYSAVGTPDYVAPEVQGKGGYTETVDWWSMGVILYEMLVGYPPFVSEQPSETWHKILNWKKYFSIPKQANVSGPAQDLIKRLINDPKERLGVNGVEEIKAHPFFAGIDWKRIRDKKAPYVPQVKNPFDTRNFDAYEEEETWDDDRKNSRGSRKDAMFIGYTFKKNDQKQSELLKALIDLDMGNIPLETEKPSINVCDSLQLDKPRIELTQAQRRKIFKKEKEESTTGRLDHKEMRDLFSLTTSKLYTNRAVKKGELPTVQRFESTMQAVNKNNYTVETMNKSKERAVKMSPSQFGKEKQEVIKKLMLKGNLRANPINLTTKRN